MHFEVFHAGLLGRTDVIAVDMIHHTGLWGICFSHHPPHNNHPRYAADTTTEGVLRFLEEANAGQGSIPLSSLSQHTLTTHHVDADAILPVWALLHPQTALAQRGLLARVARSGDFFIYLDDTSAKINFTIEALHQQLRGTGARGERIVQDELTHRCFARLLPEMQDILDDTHPYVSLWEPAMRALDADLAYLQQPGRVTECWDQHLSFVSADHALDTHALNTLCRNDLLLTWRTDTHACEIAVRPAIAWYELTSLPHRPRYDLNALAALLNAAEVEIGDRTIWKVDAGPVTLRTDATRLSQEKLLAIVNGWLQAAPESQISHAYREDVDKVFRCQPQHAVFTSHMRFAEAREVQFLPDTPYGGLHYLGQNKPCSAEMSLLSSLSSSQPSGELRIAKGKSPVPFAVTDDFAWNYAAPQPLELSIAYIDNHIGNDTDNNTGHFRVEYDAWNTPCETTSTVSLCGDGQEKTVTFRLPNARLGNSQEQGADLRLVRSPGTALWLRALTLRKQV
jgi:hypothetical protein